jgi:hypothetical protein
MLVGPHFQLRRRLGAVELIDAMSAWLRHAGRSIELQLHAAR